MARTKRNDLKDLLPRYTHAELADAMRDAPELCAQCGKPLTDDAPYLCDECTGMVWGNYYGPSDDDWAREAESIAGRRVA